MGAMTVRECTIADAEGINRLLLQTNAIHTAGAPEFFALQTCALREEQLASLLAAENKLLLCAEADGAVVGFCELTLLSASGMVQMKNAHIENIVVDACCRGQGIGHALIAEAEARAAAWGAKQLNLMCWEFNGGARRLYESLGLRAQRTIMIKEIGGTEPDQCDT